MAPSVFTHLRTVGALEIGSLLREDHVGPIFRGEEFHSGLRGREVVIASAHRVGEHDAGVGHDVQINSVIRTSEADFYLEALALDAADAKIHSEFFDRRLLARRKPAALLG